MSHRGFSLVELLVALAVCALVSGALAAAVPPARAAFEATPAMLDLHQRTRSGIEAVSAAIRTAGVGVGVPAVLPFVSATGGQAFDAVLVVVAGPGAARGALAVDQASPHGPITLDAGPGCPQAGDVCGFIEGATAIIFDGGGRFDVFEVAATNSFRGQIAPDAALAVAYAAGAVVIEAETLQFEAAPQPDGSRSLIRLTSEGATQPIVEGVTRFWVDAFAAAAGGPLRQLSPSELADGPWCEGGVDVPAYDADALGIRRIDVSLAAEVSSASLRGPAGRLFSRSGTAAHAPLRWVPDRRVKVSVALRNVP